MIICINDSCKTLEPVQQITSAGSCDNGCVRTVRASKLHPIKVLVFVADRLSGLLFSASGNVTERVPVEIDLLHNKICFVTGNT